MPLPPRDLSSLHLSLNPGLAQFHHIYPLSRYIPAVALFRLYKLACDGVLLAPMLDPETWMTLACLDDLSADFCIGRTLATAPMDRPSVNATLVHCAAPYLVPMMVSVPPAAAGGGYSLAMAPQHQHHAATPAGGAAFPQYKLPAPTPVAAPAATTRRAPQPQPQPPPPPPPRAPAPAATSSESESTAADSSASTSNPRLSPSVMRVVCALIKDCRGRVDMNFFDSVAPRLERMSDPVACKALREFAGQLRAAGRPSEPGQHRKMFSGVMTKYESYDAA